MLVKHSSAECAWVTAGTPRRQLPVHLGPNPAASLTQMLDHAFASGRQMTCNPVYFSKSGLPWQAELTLAPLLDLEADLEAGMDAATVHSTPTATALSHRPPDYMGRPNLGSLRNAGSSPRVRQTFVVDTIAT